MFLTMFTNTKALSKFYIGYQIEGIRYVKDKNGTKVYSDFKTIHKDGTNELAYCIQPGVKISGDYYQEYEGYNDVFYIDDVKMEKVRLIAHYGYLYENHTDIKWYVVTQYLIWQAVKPTTWEIYFVDNNNNPLYDLFSSEINEINYLIRNHHNKPNINNDYVFNYNEDIYVEDSNNLLKYYYPSSGDYISNSMLRINNDLEPGDYSFNLRLIDKSKPLFYNHYEGQDLFTRGEILQDNINFNIHITAGNIKIDECDQKTFEKETIGGTYEILDQDDEVIDEITCFENEECLSKMLPVGYYKIRVKNLNDDFEINENIYDIQVTDQNVSTALVCSLKKEKNVVINQNFDSELTINTNNYFINNTLSFLKKIYINNSDNSIDIDSNFSIDNDNQNKNIFNFDNDSKQCKCSLDDDLKSSEELVDNSTDDKNKDYLSVAKVPNTSRNRYLLVILSFLSIILYYFSFLRHEKRV